MDYRKWIFSALLFGVWLIAPLDGVAIIADREAPIQPLPIPLSPSPNHWPSTLILKTPETACTATAVGPQVILTAAICVSDNRTPVVTVGNRTYSLECDQNPSYPSKASADSALCKTRETLPIAKFESLSFDTRLIRKKGQTVVLVGFGCRIAGGADRNFGILSVGTAQTRKASANAEGFIVTKGAALCAGDGGGAAYAYTEPNKTKRVIIGVASRSDIGEFSWIAPTMTPKFQKWAEVWSASNGVSICGLSDDKFACRAEPVVAKTVVTQPRSSAAGVTATALKPAEIAPLGNNVLSGTIIVDHDKGETLKEIVERACGERNEDYYQLLFKHHQAQTGAILTKDTTYVAPGAIDIPSCLAGSYKKRINEVTGEHTIWSFFHKHSRSSGWTAFTSDDASTAEMRKKVFVDYIKTLNPDLDPQNITEEETVLVPVSSPTASRVLTQGPAITVTAAYGEPSQSPEYPVVASADPTSSVVSPVFSITDVELQNSNQACRSRPSPDTPYPYDLDATLDALLRNQQVTKVESKKVTVLIADSGLYGGETGIFRIGATDAKVLQKIIPLSSGLKLSHGTQVASLVLGGPVFARFNAITNPRIELEIHRIFVERSFIVRLKDKLVTITKPALEEDAFLKVVRDALNFAPIVNLSLKSRKDILAIRDNYLSVNSTILFIVAAGNFDLNLDVNTVYPAAYGGHGQPGQYNLLTVASLEPDGSVASHSNFSPTYVEIGAPGCQIPVLSYDLKSKELVKVDNVNGTSLAAPIVTFAAALVKYELPKAGAKQIKKRLLISADLNQKIEDKIEDGRTLNIVKAVSLHQDLIELKEPRKILKGTAVFEKDGSELSATQHIEFCEGKISVPIKWIFKIWPYRKTDGTEMVKIYFRKAASTSFLEKADCKNPAGIKILLKNDKGKKILPSYRLNQIIDFVKASRQ